MKAVCFGRVGAGQGRSHGEAVSGDGDELHCGSLRVKRDQAD